MDQKAIDRTIEPVKLQIQSADCRQQTDGTFALDITLDDQYYDKDIVVAAFNKLLGDCGIDRTSVTLEDIPDAPKKHTFLVVAESRDKLDELRESLKGEGVDGGLPIHHGTGAGSESEDKEDQANPDQAPAQQESRTYLGAAVNAGIHQEGPGAGLAIGRGGGRS